MKHWIYALLLLNCINSHAAPSDFSGELTLQQVIIYTLENNPLLIASDYEASAAAARIRQAQQQPATEISLELEDLIGSGDFSGLARAQTSLSLATILESPDKTHSRTALAEQKANLLRTTQDSRRLDLLATAAEQFIAVVVAQQRLAIGLEQTELIQHIHELVRHRVEVGRSHVAEQRRTAITLARAQIQLEHARHQLATARLKLVTSWGETRADFSTASAALFELAPLADFEQLEKLLANNPDLIRFASEERVAQAQLRVAQMNSKADLSLSGGVRYFNEQNDAALIFSASIPLGSESRAKPHIYEKQYLALREPHRYEQQRLLLYSSLYGLYQELTHARGAFDALNSEIIPQAERTASDYEAGYNSGRFSLLELTEAQQTLIEARLERVIAAGNYHRYRIEIERLTGAAMQSGNQP